MFYSKDLLGRKTPLGAIWTLAHGRKLSKGKIISIDLKEICQEILQPGVPHSLRLQGILIGGVVLVFSKQQAYLLEDLQDMMRRVDAAGRQAAGTAEGPGGARGGKATKSMLKKERKQAKLEAITVDVDIEELLGADVAGGGLMGLGLSLGSLSGGGGSLAGGLGGRRGGRQQLGGGELAEGLFVMPSLPSTSEGAGTSLTGATASERQQGAKSRLRALEAGSGGQPQQQEDVYGGLLPGMDDWLNPDEEMFDVNPDLNLLGDLGLPAAALGAGAAAGAGAGAGSHATRSASGLQQQQQGDSFADMELEDALLHDEAAAALAAAPEASRDSRPPSSRAATSDTAAASDQTDKAARLARAAAASEEQQEEHEEEAEAAQERKPAVRRSRKRAHAAVVDGMDDLVISSREYRQWVADTSNILRPAGGADALGAGAGGLPAVPLGELMAAALPLSLVALPSGLSLRGAFGLPGLRGAAVPAAAAAGFVAPELLQLFSPPAAKGGGGGGFLGTAGSPGSPEVNNSTGEGALPRHRRVHREALPLTRVPGADADDMQLDEHEAAQPDELMQQELLSNDEAHDQLMDLPFAHDGAVERMRAAPTPASGSLSSPGTGLMREAAAARAAGRRATSSGTSGSSMMLGRLARRGAGSDAAALGDEVQSGQGLRRTLRMASGDLSLHDELHDGGVFFGGAGNLADLLPDVPLPGDDEEEHEQLQHGLQQPLGGSGGAGTAVGLLGSSQYQLLEETEPTQPTQLPGGGAGVATHASKVVLSIFRERLQRAAEAAEADATAEPSLSLFGLLREGQLSRVEAAKLFYQVCVTSTAGYVHASQERPYGDITITAGTGLL